MAKSLAQKAQENAAKVALGIVHFQYLAEAIFENAIGKIGNVGQAFIVTELAEKSIGPMMSIIAGSKRQPTKLFFRSLFKTVLGPEKYNAISIIIEEMIEQLIEAWDDSTLQDDRQRVKIFLDTQPEDYIDTPPSAEQMMWASRAKLISGRL